MGFLDDLGLKDIGVSFDPAGIVSSLGDLAKFFFILILCGALFGIWYYSRNRKKLYDKVIPIFEEVNGRFVHRPKLDDRAMEMVIPGTSVKVFFLKRHKIYLPRGTIMMSDGEYWYGIRRNREWVNFSIVNLNKEMKEAKLDYDHTDMRYANTQLKKLLERSYKKQKWYERWKSEIAIILLVLMLTFSFWFLLGEIRGLISDLGPVMDAAERVMQAAEKVLGAADTFQSGSGIKPAG